MKTFKEFIRETYEVPGRQIAEKELVAMLGKGKVKSLVTNPFFKEYSSYQKAFKHGVSPAGFPWVEVYFYFASVHKTADGKIRPQLMVKFVFGYTGWKIINAHKYLRSKVPGERELKWGPSAGWEHHSDWKKSDDLL